MEDTSQIWKYYNNLPSLQEAHDQFTNRDKVFPELAKLLSKHGNKYGVCLVHAHCTLSEGEIMSEDDDTTQPTLALEAHSHYTERWLPSGEPYEFSTSLTQSPPQALLDEFRALTQDVNVLGLYYAASDDDDGARLEWTEGRKNLVRKMTAEDWDLEPVETAWNLGRGDPVTMACVLLCARDTTESGGGHLKKKVHRKVT